MKRLQSAPWVCLLVGVVTELFLLLAGSVRAEEPMPAITVPCMIISAHDGDTICAEIRVRMNIRLLDVWAPELKEPRGPAARDRLKQLASGKPGTLKIPLSGKDNLADLFTFGRLLGTVWVDGQDVGAVLVEEGLATKTKGK